MNPAGATSTQMKRISVFNVIGFIFFILAVISVYVIKLNDEILFAGMQLTTADFWSIYLLMLTVNTVIFVDLWYYEEDDLFHNHMVNQSSKLRKWDFLLRCLITIFMVAWLIPNFLQVDFIQFLPNKLVAYIYHISIISFLLLIWAWPVNRGRAGEWILITGEKYQIKGQVWKFLLPYIMIIGCSILLIVGTYVIENPQSLLDFLSKLSFISQGGKITTNNIKVWIRAVGVGLSIFFVILVLVLRIGEWRRVFFIGRLV